MWSPGSGFGHLVHLRPGAGFLKPIAVGSRISAPLEPGIGILGLECAFSGDLGASWGWT